MQERALVHTLRESVYYIIHYVDENKGTEGTGSLLVTYISNIAEQLCGQNEQSMAQNYHSVAHFVNKVRSVFSFLSTK